MAVRPAGHALIGAGDAVDRGLVEVPGRNLERERHAGGREAGRHRKRGMAGDIERLASLARIGAQHLRLVLNGAGGLHAGRADESVHAGKRVRHTTCTAPPLPERAQIVPGREIGARDQPFAAEPAIGLRLLLQPAFVDRPGLCPEDDAVDARIVLKRAWIDLDDLRALAFQHPGGFVDGGAHLRRGRHVPLVPAAHNADLHALHAALQPGGV